MPKPKPEHRGRPADFTTERSTFFLLERLTLSPLTRHYSLAKAVTTINRKAACIKCRSNVSISPAHWSIKEERDQNLTGKGQSVLLTDVEMQTESHFSAPNSL